MSEESKPTNQSSLIIRPSTGVASVPNGGSSAMSEMISRSLVHIQTSNSLAVPIRQAGEEQEFEIARGVKIVMCWIPPGEFLMGSPENEGRRQDDEIQHPVRISRGFWLAKTQTTQAQWQVVMGNNDSFFRGSDLPVETVGLKIEVFLEKSNCAAPKDGVFHLPTEAQWEYACRAGTSTSLNNGKNLENLFGTSIFPNLDEIAWHKWNSGGKTHPVGLKMANAWGLHDMLGNVYEKCTDWYGCYPNEAVKDPTGPISGSIRVSRGGGYGDYPHYCRVANRKVYYDYPGGGSYYGGSGFRIARSLIS